MAKIITQSDYTRTLVRKRNDLADNIETKGVEASQEEKLNTLVPKVLDISTGGRGGAPMVKELEFGVPAFEMSSVKQSAIVNDVVFAATAMIEFEEEIA